MENSDIWPSTTMDDYDNEAHTLTYSCIMAPDRCTKRFLNISDTFIALVIVTPLVVAYWYGTWVFMDNHMEYFPPIPTFAFGVIWNTLIVLVRHHVHERMKTTNQQEKTLVQRIFRYLFTKLFIYTFSIAGIMVFRAIFVLCDPYGKLSNRNYFITAHEDIQIVVDFQNDWWTSR